MVERVEGREGRRKRRGRNEDISNGHRISGCGISSIATAQDRAWHGQKVTVRGVAHVDGDIEQLTVTAQRHAIIEEQPMNPHITPNSTVIQ